MFGSSVRPSVRLSVILSRLQTMCNILSCDDHTVTKLGLQVLLLVAHTSLTSHAPGGGAGLNVGPRNFDFVAAGGICVSQTHI